ncbi:MAG: hypothetical protein U0165_06000 [Polyangiaceae bacterium]
MRRTQGFSYFPVTAFRRSSPRLFPMGTLLFADATQFGSHFIDFGRWDSQMPFRVCKDYSAGKMTSSDPRLSIVFTGLPPGVKGRLFVCVTSPDEVALYFCSADKVMSRFDPHPALCEGVAMSDPFSVALRAELDAIVARYEALSRAHQEALAAARVNESAELRKAVAMPSRSSETRTGSGRICC